MKLTRTASGLTKEEYSLLASLSTPVKIQDFLDAVPMNFEEGGDTHRSPRAVLRARKAHCIEGAMLAATALAIAGEPPLIMNLSARLGRGDVDHVIALYKRGGAWGAVSKTNHAVLRFRDPVYRTLRELALSYFNEWFLPSGEKTLECYSRPLDLSKRFGTGWITTEENLWDVAEALSILPHYDLVPKGNWRYVRPADAMEIKAGTSPEYLPPELRMAIKAECPYPSHTPNAETRKAIEEIMNPSTRANLKRYASAEEMFTDILGKNWRTQ